MLLCRAVVITLCQTIVLDVGALCTSKRAFVGTYAEISLLFLI